MSKPVIKEHKIKKGEDKVESIKATYLDSCDGNIINAYHAVCEALLVKDLFMDIALKIPQKQRQKAEMEFAKHYFDVVGENGK